MPAGGENLFDGKQGSMMDGQTDRHSKTKCPLKIVTPTTGKGGKHENDRAASLESLPISP